MAVTYAQVSHTKNESSRHVVVVDLGYSAEAYSAGVPVDFGKLGFRTKLESLTFVNPESNTARLFKFDSTNNKIRAYAADTGTEVSGTLTANLRVLAVGY